MHLTFTFTPTVLFQHAANLLLEVHPQNFRLTPSVCCKPVLILLQYYADVLFAMLANSRPGDYVGGSNVMVGLLVLLLRITQFSPLIFGPEVVYAVPDL